MGYTQDPFGRIRWHEKPKKGEVTDEELRKIEGSIARRAQNMKIQSMSANITKMALRDIYRYLIGSGYGRMVLTIHDSVFLELHMDTAPRAIPEILKIMVDAGEKVYPGMVTPVDYDIGVKERRLCRITGIPFYVYSHVFENGTVSPNRQWVETRVYAILDGNISDIPEARTRLLSVVSERDEEWREKNRDIINALTKGHHEEES